MSGGLRDLRRQRIGDRADIGLGLLLAVQALVWVFGYRKAIADEAESA
jgi:hypothetical protein